MGLQTTFQGLAVTAYSVFSDLSVAAILSRESQSGYDVAVGAVETKSSAYTINVIKELYNNKEIDGTRIKLTDLKISFPANSLEIVPASTDSITIGDKKYSIISITTDPATAVWTMQIREYQSVSQQTGNRIK